MKTSHIAETLPKRPISLPEWLLRDGQVLLVETPAILEHLLHASGKTDPIVTRLELIGPAMLRRIAPIGVIAPLIGRRWDIMDLALRLESARFRGRLLAVSEPLPRGGLVLRELRSSFPDLDIRLLELPAD